MPLFRRAAGAMLLIGGNMVAGVQTFTLAEFETFNILNAGASTSVNMDIGQLNVQGAFDLVGKFLLLGDLEMQGAGTTLRLPNCTTVEKNAISSPGAGMTVFDTNLAKLCVYTGATWETITST